MIFAPIANPIRLLKRLSWLAVYWSVGASALAAAADEGEPEEAADAVQAGRAFPRAESVFPQLEKILVDALSQSPGMVQESLTRLEAGYIADSERSVLYPKIGGYASFNIQREDRLDAEDSSTGERTYFSFSLNQPVFHWGSLKAQAEVAEINRRLADRAYADAYQLLANRIRDAYLQLVALRVAQRNRALDLAHARAQLEIVRQRVAEGAMTGGAITGIEQAIESQVLAGDRADFALRRSLRQFQQLIGNPEFKLEDVPETIPPIPEVADAQAVPLRTEYVTRRGFEQSSGFYRAQRLLDIDRLRLSITRQNLKPKLNFATGVSQDLDNRTTNVEQRFMLTTYYAGLQVNWSIWDGRYSRAIARATQARIRRAEKQLEVLERDLIESIEAAEKELGFSTRGLRIAERNYSSAEGGYNTAAQFLKEGRASQSEVDSALLGWRSSEYGVCESRRDYLRTVAAFLAVVQADPLIDKLQREGRIPR